VVNAIAIGDKIKSVRITGDKQALFEAQKDKLAEWNKILDLKFPRK